MANTSARISEAGFGPNEACGMYERTSMHVCSYNISHCAAASNGDAPSPAPAAPAPRSALDELYDTPQPASQAQPSKPPFAHLHASHAYVFRHLLVAASLSVHVASTSANGPGGLRPDVCLTTSRSVAEQLAQVHSRLLPVRPECVT